MERSFRNLNMRDAYRRGVAKGKTWDRTSGNGSRFWKGYDMHKDGHGFAIYPRDTIAHAYWCAGQDVAKAEGA